MYVTRKECELNDQDNFMTFHAYPDAMTLNLIQAIAKVLDVKTDDVMMMFGKQFLTFCMKHGYDKMLTTLGGDMVSFIENLDSLHTLISFTYNDIVPPSFRCVENDDGSLILHYYSVREGLAPMVEGVLKAVAKEFFQQSATMTLLSHVVEETGVDAKVNHTEFFMELVNLQPEESGSQPMVVHRRSRQWAPPLLTEPAADPGTPSIVRSEDFSVAFPYHILMDRLLLIQECGDNISKLSLVPVVPGTHFSKVATILQPPIFPSTKTIFSFINSSYLIALRCHAGQNPIILKGQMLWLPYCLHLLFVGSPHLSSLKNFQRMHLFLCDIPLYDVTRELLLLNQQRIAEIDVAKKLDEVTLELKKVSKDLEEEKQKTKELLQQMVPPVVLLQRDGDQAVLAEKYESCTVLFCDIVSFTEIAQKSTADDLVTMLNDIFHRFDAHTFSLNVFRVDTIGDAYIAVTGVAQAPKDHAGRMADFAMDMLEEACYVMSPSTRKPIKIRVGIHSGGVIAGVVGKKLPRYDIYGDTVNTASRMASYSSGGRIHLSVSTFDLLYPCGYKFRVRGEIVVKGKGLLKTYFLAGHSLRPMSEPVDPFSDLPMVMNTSPFGRMSKRKARFSTALETSSCLNQLPSATRIESELSQQRSVLAFRSPLPSTTRIESEVFQQRSVAALRNQLPSTTRVESGVSQQRSVAAVRAGSIDKNTSAFACPPSASHHIALPRSPVQNSWSSAHMPGCVHSAKPVAEDCLWGQADRRQRVCGSTWHGISHSASRRDALHRTRSAGAYPLPARSRAATGVPVGASPHGQRQEQGGEGRTDTTQSPATWRRTSLPISPLHSGVTPAFVTGATVFDSKPEKSVGTEGGVRQVERGLDRVIQSIEDRGLQHQLDSNAAQPRDAAVSGQPLQRPLCAICSSAVAAQQTSSSCHLSPQHLPTIHTTEQVQSCVNEMPQPPGRPLCVYLPQPAWTDKGTKQDHDRSNKGSAELLDRGDGGTGNRMEATNFGGGDRDRGNVAVKVDHERGSRASVMEQCCSLRQTSPHLTPQTTSLPSQPCLKHSTPCPASFSACPESRHTLFHEHFSVDKPPSVPGQCAQSCPCCVQ